MKSTLYVHLYRNCNESSAVEYKQQVSKAKKDQEREKKADRADDRKNGRPNKTECG